MYILKNIGLFLLAILLFQIGIEAYHHIEGWTAPVEEVSAFNSFLGKFFALLGAYFYGWITSSLPLSK